MSKKKAVKMPQKAAVTLNVALEESRVALWSGWENQLNFRSKIWGNVVAKGPGFTQNHADILDFARTYYRGIDFDSEARATLAISFTDFARLKGIEPAPALHRALFEDFQHTTIQICTPDGRVIKFVICDRAEYLVSRPDKNKPIPPRSKNAELSREEIREHNRACVPRPEESIFIFRLSTEFQEFLTTSKTVDYSALLPDIVRLPSDTAKRITRFFLGHTKWGCYTDALYSAIFPVAGINPKASAEEKDRLRKVEKSAKSRRKKVMKSSAAMLEKLFGIKYDPVRDYWSYEQHPGVKISKALTGYKALPAPENPGQDEPED